jgi:hypothetical protein
MICNLCRDQEGVTMPPFGVSICYDCHSAYIHMREYLGTDADDWAHGIKVMRAKRGWILEKTGEKVSMKVVAASMTFDALTMKRK